MLCWTLNVLQWVPRRQTEGLWSSIHRQQLWNKKLEGTVSTAEVSRISVDWNACAVQDIMLD